MAMKRNSKKEVDKLFKDLGTLFYTWQSKNSIETSLIISLAIDNNTNEELKKISRGSKFKHIGIYEFLSCYKNQSDKTFKMHTQSLTQTLIATYGHPDDDNEDNDNDDNDNNDDDN
jgi:hypothetical protein